MASVGAGEQMSGTPFSSSLSLMTPAASALWASWWLGGGALRQSSLLVPRSTAATPKA